MRVPPSWQDTNNRGRDHLKSSSGQRDLLEAKQMISSGVGDLQMKLNKGDCQVDELEAAHKRVILAKS